MLMRICYAYLLPPTPNRPPCSSRIVGGIKRLPDGTPDYKEDFFSKPAFLTVSGQLQVCACGMKQGAAVRAWRRGTRKRGVGSV